MSKAGDTKFFYGYWILLAGLLLLFIMSGVGFYAFGVFFKPIQQEFGWGRGVTSVAFTMFYLVQAISSPFIGRLTDHYGPKKIITLGGLILGLGLAILSLTTDLLHFYLGYAVAGLGCSSVGMIPVSLIISSWFTHGRGTAVGIASSGMGLGGLVLPPIVGIYLIPNLGWRIAYQILAVSSFLSVIVIAQVMIKTSPHEISHSENVEHSDEAKLSYQPSRGWTLNAALKTSTFWFIMSAFVMFQLAQVGTIQHLVNHLTDIGFPVAMATVILSTVSLISAVGKLLFGYISDRLEAKYCATLSFLLGLVATAVLITVNPASSLLFIGLYILAMGLAIGGWAPLTSILISRNFGMEHYGAIFGAFSLFQYVSTGVSPTFFGYVYDSTHQYYWAYVSALVFYAAATVSILSLRRPKPSSNSSTKSTS